jgi:hypothetical protein
VVHSYSGGWGRGSLDPRSMRPRDPSREKRERKEGKERNARRSSLWFINSLAFSSYLECPFIIKKLTRAKPEIVLVFKNCYLEMTQALYAHMNNKTIKKKLLSWSCVPVIPATWEAETGRWWVQNQPGQHKKSPHGEKRSLVLCPDVFKHQR